MIPTLAIHVYRESGIDADIRDSECISRDSAQLLSDEVDEVSVTVSHREASPVEEEENVSNGGHVVSGGSVRWIAAWIAVWLVMVVVFGSFAFRLVVGRWPVGSSSDAAVRGVLRIHTSPPGATIFLDHAKQPQRTPAALTIDRARPYLIQLDHPDRMPWHQRVALGVHEGHRRIDVALHGSETRWGTLAVTASDRADIFLDGRRVGTQTERVTLANVQAGVPHTLRLVSRGHDTIRETIEVAPGKVSSLDFKLRRVDTVGPRK